jgi:DHA1 family inner membrane transport protein
MAYFRNNTVNLLNLHYGLHSFALSGSSAFFGVFLLKSGVPAPIVLLSIAAILLGRLLIRPSVLIFAKRFGVKPLLIAGTIATSLQYPLLAEVDGIGVGLVVLCAISSIGDTLYWTTYHAYFAALGDAEHRGHQVGAREAAAAVVGVIGPLATGWALTTLGPARCLRRGRRRDAAGRVAHRVDAECRGTPADIGHAQGGHARPSVVCGGCLLRRRIRFRLADRAVPLAERKLLGVRRRDGAGGVRRRCLIDAGHGTRAAIVALVVMALTTTLRAVSVGNAPLAVLANASGALVACLYVPVLGTAIYNQAKRSPCALRFHIASEAGWDLGGVCALLVAAGLLQAGVPIGTCILLSLLGALASFYLLRTYFSTLKPVV